MECINSQVAGFMSPNFFLKKMRCGIKMECENN